MTFESPRFGTVEYYCEQFSDVLCDIGDDGGTSPVDYRGNCLAGLVKALKGWAEHHELAAKRYKEFTKDLYTTIQHL